MLVAVPGRHVGDDDAVAGLQALGNLHAVVGSPPKDNVHAGGVIAIVGNLEEGERVAGVRLQGPLDEGGLWNSVDIKWSRWRKGRCALHAAADP